MISKRSWPRRMTLSKRKSRIRFIRRIGVFLHVSKKCKLNESLCDLAKAGKKGFYKFTDVCIESRSMNEQIGDPFSHC